MKMVFSYYISCAVPYLIVLLGIVKHGWHGYSGDILTYVIAALIVSIINIIWGLILLPLSYLHRKQFNRIIAAMLAGGLCPIVIAILISMLA